MGESPAERPPVSSPRWPIMYLPLEPSAPRLSRLAALCPARGSVISIAGDPGACSSPSAPGLPGLHEPTSFPIPLSLTSLLLPPACGHSQPDPASGPTLPLTEKPAYPGARPAAADCEDPGRLPPSGLRFPLLLPSAHSYSQHALRSHRLHGPAPARHVSSRPFGPRLLPSLRFP